MKHTLFTTLTLLATTLLSAEASTGQPIAAGEVWIVDAAGGGDFLDIEGAVTAAMQGDTILVRSGSYSGFAVWNKSLEVAADGAQPPRITGDVTVEALGAGRHVSLSGFNFRSEVDVSDCLGTVLFSDCSFTPQGLNQLIGSTPGSQTVSNSADVIFTDSQFVGRNGDTHHYCGDVWDGSDGENGLWISNSTVSLYASTLRGGQGGPSEDGACLAVCVSAIPSDGGHGIEAVDNSTVYLDDVEPLLGLRGPPLDCDGAYGEDGQYIRQDCSCTILQANDPVLHLQTPVVVREDQPLDLVLRGPGNATAFLIWSAVPDYRYLGLDLGILHLRSTGLNFVPLGKIPGNGALQASVTPPGIPVGEDALRVYAQPFCFHAGGRLLGNVRDIAVVDPAF